MTVALTLYEGLDRLGPGDVEAVDWALGVAGTPPGARILDAGCGTGADIPGLRARAPEGSVVGIDSHAPFLAGVADRCPWDMGVSTRVGDMADPEGEFDLIWSAGSLYVLGVEAGLRIWRGHLAPGGKIAFTQIAWRLSAVPEAPRAFWAEAYPEMTDAAGVLAAAEAAGYRVLDHRWLPSSAWLAYYGPLEARCDALSPAEGPLADAVAGARAEIALWRLHGGSYGYLQVVVEPA